MGHTVSFRIQLLECQCAVLSYQCVAVGETDCILFDGFIEQMIGHVGLCSIAERGHLLSTFRIEHTQF